MNVSWLVLLIAAGLLLFAGFVGGLVLFVFFLAKSISGGTGGWRALAERYATAKPPASDLMRGQTVRIGIVDYNRCASLGVEDHGLYLSIGGKIALIPWGEFVNMEQITWHWQKVPRFTIGEPPVATLIVKSKAYEPMKPHLTGLAVGPL